MSIREHGSIDQTFKTVQTNVMTREPDKLTDDKRFLLQRTRKSKRIGDGQDRQIRFSIFGVMERFQGKKPRAMAHRGEIRGRNVNPIGQADWIAAALHSGALMQ